MALDRVGREELPSAPRVQEARGELGGSAKEELLERPAMRLGLRRAWVERARPRARLRVRAQRWRGWLEPHRRRISSAPSCNVSGMEGGWRAHPDAIDVREGSLPPVKPGRVVGVGAICDLRPQRYGPRSRSFSVSEFVALEDGRRVILHEDRGFTIGWRSDQTDPGDLAGQRWTLESLTRDVLNVVLPDDDECAEEHPWSWLAELARARGLNVTAEDLRCLPYEVIVTDSVRRWIAPA